MECYINRPAQGTNFEIIFFTILKYNNYGVPVQNCDRKQKVTFQTIYLEKKLPYIVISVN